MGCDIHCYIEYKKPTSTHWKSFAGGINPGRDYRTFERLAGVRGLVENAVVPPRGVPKDMGYAADEDYWLYISDSQIPEDGCCTKQDAIKWHAAGHPYKVDIKGLTTWVRHPDWHTYSWMNRLEFALATSNAGEEYQAIDAIMASLAKNGNEVRIVFWFDN